MAVEGRDGTPGFITGTSTAQRMSRGRPGGTFPSRRRWPYMPPTAGRDDWGARTPGDWPGTARPGRERCGPKLFLAVRGEQAGEFAYVHGLRVVIHAPVQPAAGHRRGDLQQMPAPLGLLLLGGGFAMRSEQPTTVPAKFSDYQGQPRLGTFTGHRLQDRQVRGFCGRTTIVIRARHQGVEVKLQEVEVPGNDGGSEARILVDRDPLRRDRPLEQAHGHQGIRIGRVDRLGLSGHPVLRNALTKTLVVGQLGCGRIHLWVGHRHQILVVCLAPRSPLTAQVRRIPGDVWLIPQVVSPDGTATAIPGGKQAPVVFQRRKTRLIGVVAEDVQVFGPCRHAFPGIGTCGMDVEPRLVGEAEQLIELGQPLGIELARLGKERTE